MSKKHNNFLYYMRGITSETRGGALLRSLAPGQYNSEERRRGNELFATLCLIRPTREPNTRPAAPLTP